MAGCRYLTQEEVRRIRQALANGPEPRARNVALHVLGCHSGFRAAELLRLRRYQLLDEDGHLQQWVKLRTKGGHSRTVRIHTGCRDDVLRWLQEQDRRCLNTPLDYVFTCGRTPMAYHTALSILQKAARRAGIRGDAREIGTHCWRKTFAHRMYQLAMAQLKRGENVEPIRMVQRALGHRSVQSTERYLEDIQAAVDELIPQLEIM